MPDGLLDLKAVCKHAAQTTTSAEINRAEPGVITVMACLGNSILEILCSLWRVHGTLLTVYWTDLHSVCGLHTIKRRIECEKA